MYHRLRLINRSVAVFVLTICSAIPVFAQVFIPADRGSLIKFTIKNFGFTVEGFITHLKGSIRFDPAIPGQTAITVTADVATINTGNTSRDKHLQKTEYFDASAYPEIKFVSDKIEKNRTQADSYVVTGKFTIKGNTRLVSFPFTAARQASGWLFTGSVLLNRRDFGVGGNSLVLADTLTLMITLFASP
jgi:polyisoprenoid-binding protein YceI